MARIDESITQVRSDEPCSPGHKDAVTNSLHESTFFTRRRLRQCRRLRTNLPMRSIAPLVEA